MRIIFAGTPDFACPSLRALADSRREVACVLTQPDRGRGRGRRRSASPVKQLALEMGLEVAQPASLRDTEAQDAIAGTEAELMVVAAYGQMLPPEVLQAPVLGCINVHASLLPRWRGAAPIQRAILAGDSESGVSIMQVVQRLDSGDVLLQRRCPIGARTTGGELHDRLARMGGDALIEAINALEMGSIAPRAQDEAAATYAKKLDKAEARLGWRESAPALARAVRAFNPWPVAHTRLAGKTVRVWMAEALDEPSPGAPGSVIRASARGVDVATGQGVLRIEALQWSGGRVLEAREAVNGFVFQGQRFD